MPFIVSQMIFLFFGNTAVLPKNFSTSSTVCILRRNWTSQEVSIYLFKIRVNYGFSKLKNSDIQILPE